MDRWALGHTNPVFSYGPEQLAEDVAKLRDLNRQLVEECVVEVADNTKLEGDFRMAMAMVEGYNINMEKPWCAPFAWSEPTYTRKVRTAHCTMV